MKEFGKLDFSTSFDPTSAFPLDARCEFDSYDAALAAAQTAGEVGNKESKYYYGMIFTVHGETVEKYVVQTDGTLELLGTGAGGGECDWNNMKNKPFYSEFGSEGGYHVVAPEVSFDADDVQFYKVAEAPKEEQLIGATLSLAIGEEAVVDNLEITEDLMVTIVDGVVLIADMLLVVQAAGEYAPDNGDGTTSTINVPEAGVYLPADPTAEWQTVNLSISWNKTKPLDPVYLPMDAIDARIDAYIEEALGGDY